MPSEIFFTTGTSLKVIEDVDLIGNLLSSGTDVLDTHRFAGFRGEEAVAGERAVVNLDAVAYVIAITGP